MNKILLSFVFMLLAVQALAQISIGAGYSNNCVVQRDYDNYNRNGYYLEGIYTSQESEHWEISYGVRYTNSFNVLSSSSAKMVDAEHDISVPFTVNYGFQRANARFFAFAGPSLNYCLAQVSRVKLHDEWGKPHHEDSIKRFDVGLGGGIGVRIGNIQCSAGYDFGLLNVDGASKSHINRLHIGVAYIL